MALVVCSMQEGERLVGSVAKFVFLAVLPCHNRLSALEVPLYNKKVGGIVSTHC